MYTYFLGDNFFLKDTVLPHTIFMEKIKNYINRPFTSSEFTKGSPWHIFIH